WFAVGGLFADTTHLVPWTCELSDKTGDMSGVLVERRGLKKVQKVHREEYSYPVERGFHPRKSYPNLRYRRLSFVFSEVKESQPKSQPPGFLSSGKDSPAETTAGVFFYFNSSEEASKRPPSLNSQVSREEPSQVQQQQDRRLQSLKEISRFPSV
ncbi:hypothetical protein J6590_094992, partial [Homalodisca vitripennis]